MRQGQLSTVEPRLPARPFLLLSLFVETMETLLFFWLLLAPNGVFRSQPGPNHKGLLTRYPNLANANLKTDENWESLDGELEVDPDYPTERIEEAVAKAPKEVADWLRKEVNHIRNRRSTEQRGSEFQQRICPVIFSDMLPRVARRSIDPQDFKLYHPVNLPEHVQRVKTARCVQNISTVSPMDEEEHQCKQEYVNVPLISVVTGSTDLVVRFFSFPHGCTCFLREN